VARALALAWELAAAVAAGDRGSFAPEFDHTNKRKPALQTAALAQIAFHHFAFS
jgi:hypothetical protein